MSTVTVGEALVHLLEAHGVEIVFGIPGVHTAELYRGLASSKLRHVTPRHEQGAGFMADGYARVTGRPGVCFVITGPGLTNTITAMAQARADSVPMLVISGVNARGKVGSGLLHELPDQQAMMKSFAKDSVTLAEGAGLARALSRCLALATAGRPGPVHLEIPTDVMVERIEKPEPVLLHEPAPKADEADHARAAALIAQASAPLIFAGGGAVRAEAALVTFARRIGAPVVLTANARGMMAGDPLQVPASASLAHIRSLSGSSDLAIAVGTELGQTDYDVYADGGFHLPDALIRIDVSADQIAAGPLPTVSIVEDSASALSRLLPYLPKGDGSGGAIRAANARKSAWENLPAKIKGEIMLLHALRDAVPEARFVGDSTQLVYAGNLYYEASAPGRWFNSATGYGALGYVPPAAIGAALGEPTRPVIAIVGDGGLQFSAAELGTAVDERLDIVFLVWNNHGYREIETFMLDAGIVPAGVTPTAPDMENLATAFGLGFHRVGSDSAAVDAVRAGIRHGGVHLVEMTVS